MRTARILNHFVLLLLLLLPLMACDNLHPQNTFRLAVPEGDHTYYNSAQHMKSFLEQGGFKVNIIITENVIDANRLVAQGQADLTFIMNHSEFIPSALGPDAGKLRTICPLFDRLFFLFSREWVSDSLNARELLENTSIGIEVLNGETHSNLQRMLSSGDIDNVRIVQRDQDPDFINFWGTCYGPRTTNFFRE